MENIKYLTINIEIMIPDSRISTWFPDSSREFKWFLEPLTWFKIGSDFSTLGKYHKFVHEKSMKLLKFLIVVKPVFNKDVAGGKYQK